MKITKRQLKRIIKEEKRRILKEQGMPGIEGPVRDLWGSKEDQAAQMSTPTHASGRNQNVMSQLHTAIDALIGALGNEEAHQELLGIVEEWDTETHMTESHEGTSSENMSDAWQQILGNCLRD
jgi:hypothetical protein